MTDYKSAKKACDRNSRISERVIDGFLLYYAAAKNRLAEEMEQLFVKYRHITDTLPEDVTNRMKAQYIIYRVFKEGGTISSLLGHTAVKQLDNEALEFLEFHARNPWRFSFTTLLGSPATNFHIMEDVFTGEELLLYSPGVTKTNSESRPQLWFNLISWNGECWQSFGPIGAYSSFSADDIFFFASEVDSRIEDEESLILNVARNPLPYMMLVSGGNMPVIMSKGHQLINNISEYGMDIPDTRKLAPYFKAEFSSSVFRFSLKGWSEHPHFAQAFYDESIGVMQVSASTDEGFRVITDQFNKLGYPMSSESDIRVTTPMVITASKILRKKINLLRYESLFTEKTTPEQQESLDGINRFLSLILKDVNEGKVPDIALFAAAAGIDPEQAKAIYEQVKDIPGKPKK
jgi:hypothetical protein